MNPLYTPTFKVESRLAECFFRTHRPYSASKLNANALFPPGVFCFHVQPPFRLKIHLLLRAVLNVFLRVHYVV